MSYISPLQALWLSVFITAIYPVAGKFAVGYISPSAMLLFGTLGTVLLYAPWLTKNKLWGSFFAKIYFLNSRRWGCSERLCLSC